MVCTGPDDVSSKETLCQRWFSFELTSTNNKHEFCKIDTNDVAKIIFTKTNCIFVYFGQTRPDGSDGRGRKSMQTRRTRVTRTRTRYTDANGTYGDYVKGSSVSFIEFPSVLGAAVSFR